MDSDLEWERGSDSATEFAPASDFPSEPALSQEPLLRFPLLPVGEFVCFAQYAREQTNTSLQHLLPVSVSTVSRSCARASRRSPAA